MPTRVSVLMALLATSLWPLQAIERKPLPAFSIVALDGSQASSVDLARDGKWLLIYVQPACTPCDALLRAIDPTKEPGFSDRTIVVVGGADAAIAARLAANYPGLTGARWYADPARSTSKVLPVPGAPVVFGLKGRMLEWSRAGLVPDQRSVSSALTSWVRTAR